MQSLAFIELPNKAFSGHASVLSGKRMAAILIGCNGRVGFCGIFKHFLASSFSCSQAESTLAHTPLTQTLRRLPLVAINRVLVIRDLASQSVSTNVEPLS